MRRLPLALAMMLFAAAAYAENTHLTGGHVNGRGWLTVLDQTSRPAYVLGFKDGLYTVANDFCSNQQASGEVAFRACIDNILREVNVRRPVSEVVECISAEYLDPTMRIVPIKVVASYVCTARFTGTSAAEIERMRDAAKRQWSE